MRNNCGGIICYCTPCQCTDEPELEAAYETISKLRAEYEACKKVNQILLKENTELEIFKEAFKVAFRQSESGDFEWMDKYQYLLTSR